MRRLLVVLLGSFGVVAASGWLALPSPKAEKVSAAKSAAEDAKNRFAGTWRLVNIERLGPQGELLPSPAPPSFGSPNPVGFIMYDPAGYMGVTIMQSGRQKYAGAEPTPEEAKAALASYAAYFGTFTVNEAEGVVTHHVQGSLNPSMGPDQRRFFEFSGNRLTLKPPRGSTGAQARLTWERVPDLPELTDEHRRFIGFWKPVSSERRTPNGELLESNPGSKPGRIGFLIYTASGHMAVHLMDPGRKKYAGAQPTPEEAKLALSTYGSAYFGPYAIHKTEGFVVHHQLGMINPGGGIGTDTLRGYEFVGNKRLILRPPAQVINGQQVQGFVTWERVSPAMSYGR